MCWSIDSFVINKLSDVKFEVNVKLITEDDPDASLFLNKIMVDMHDGRGPISIVKHEGVPVISGSVVDGVKDIIFEIIQDILSDLEPALYKITEDFVEKLN